MSGWTLYHRGVPTTGAPGAGAPPVTKCTFLKSKIMVIWDCVTAILSPQHPLPEICWYASVIIKTFIQTQSYKPV